MNKKFTASDFIWSLIGIAILFASKFLPVIGTLSREGSTAIYVVISMVTLITSNCMPIGITGLIMLCALPMLGLTKSFGQTIGFFFTPVFTFAMVGFGFAEALGKVPLTKRVLRFLLTVFKKSIKSSIFAILVSAMVLSMFMSNFAVFLIYYGIMTQFLNVYENEEDRKKTGRTIFVLLPPIIACGGLCTPIGNIASMLSFGIISQAGYPLTFTQWLTIGLPMGIVLLFAIFFVMTKVFPPAELSNEKRKEFIDNLDIPKKIQPKEYLVGGILILTVLTWIFIKKFPIFGGSLQLVGLIALLLLLYPKFEIMSFNEYAGKVNWNSLFMIGGILSVCTVLSDTGVIDWLAALAVQVIPSNVSVRILILVLAIVSFLLSMLVTNTTAFYTLFGTPVLAIGLMLGFNPVILPLSLAVACSFPLLIPIGNMQSIVWGTGYINMKEYVTQGVINSALVATVMVLWLPVAINILF